MQVLEAENWERQAQEEQAEESRCDTGWMGGPLCCFNSVVLRRLCPWLTLSTSRLQVEDPKPAGKEEERILADPVAKDGCLSFGAFQKFRFNTSHSCSGER